MSAPTSKAVIAAAASGNRWHQKRIHRRLDDRDAVLDAALETVENWDPAVFPVITKVAGFDPSKASSDDTMTVSIGGADFSAGSSITAVLGTTSLTVTKNVGAQTLDLTGVNAVVDAATVGDQLMLLVRIDNVLCPPVTMTPVKA